MGVIKHICTQLFTYRTTCNGQVQMKQTHTPRGFDALSQDAVCSPLGCAGSVYFSPCGLVGWLLACLLAWLVGWLVSCLASQQHASVFYGRICSGNCPSCRAETEVAGLIFLSHAVTVH